MSSPGTIESLKRSLSKIDGRSYNAYKDLRGAYDLGDGLQLYLDHIQGDPFATPTKIRLRMGQGAAKIPQAMYSNRVRRIALQDYLAREVRHAIQQIVRGNRGLGKSGLVTIDAGFQTVLERTAFVVTEQWIEARMEIGLPARGRTILGRQAEEMLLEELPAIAKQSLRWENLNQADAEQFVNCIENQQHLRSQLKQNKLIAFVANGAALPRKSGISDVPLEDCVLFKSPPSMVIELDILHKEQGELKITGMGIPEGITLIVGGGYHGKSTLLQALQNAVYAHIPGDGREYVVCDSGAVKIRAEDGRRVEKVNISSFINNLPQNRSTTEFSSDDASGSTSQATNIIEALELGSSLLLLDEDTSATNFMVRDARMQALVAKDREPITPFVDRIQDLRDKLQVSTILVMGGCGDYFEAADQVILMNEYLPEDATGKAKAVAKTLHSRRQSEVKSELQPPIARIPLRTSFDAAKGKRSVNIKSYGVESIQYGRHEIILRYLEQLTDPSQVQAIGHGIHWLAENLIDNKKSLLEVLELFEKELDAQGLNILNPWGLSDEHPGNFARARKYELAAAINRLRTLKIQN